MGPRPRLQSSRYRAGVGIDPSFGPLIPICRELQLEGAGYADALMLNPLGMPTLVECKLWRNPEARRKVVAQILDYARVLRTWTFSDLQREIGETSAPIPVCERDFSWTVPTHRS